MVNLFPREVPSVLNLFPRELIESTLKDFPNANPKLHLPPDPRPKTRGAAGNINISPRVRCEKTAEKTRVRVTQLNCKLHCRDFVRMVLVGSAALGNSSSSSGRGSDASLQPVHTGEVTPGNKPPKIQQNSHFNGV